MSEDNDKKTLSFWKVMKSTLAAAFGVQSGQNRADDFQHGKPIHYIIAGIIFTFVFVMTIIGLVKFILNQAGVN